MMNGCVYITTFNRTTIVILITHGFPAINNEAAQALTFIYCYMN